MSGHRVPRIGDSEPSAKMAIHLSFHLTAYSGCIPPPARHRVQTHWCMHGASSGSALRHATSRHLKLPCAHVWCACGIPLPWTAVVLEHSSAVALHPPRHVLIIYIFRNHREAALYMSASNLVCGTAYKRSRYAQKGFKRRKAWCYTACKRPPCMRQWCCQDNHTHTPYLYCPMAQFFCLTSTKTNHWTDTLLML